MSRGQQELGFKWTDLSKVSATEKYVKYVNKILKNNL
jgi:hypothetical protein